jgi:hypothetical protein
VIEEWRILHTEELYGLYSTPHVIRVMKLKRLRWAGHVACVGERRSAYGVLVLKHEGRGPFTRSRHSWEDNIKMHLREVPWGHGLDLSGSG